MSASHSFFALSINTNDFWIYLEEEKYHPGVLCQEEFAQFSDVLYFFHIPYKDSMTLDRLLRLESPLITNVKQSW